LLELAYFETVIAVDFWSADTKGRKLALARRVNLALWGHG
jgi:hypothetical protein